MKNERLSGLKDRRPGTHVMNFDGKTSIGLK